jgi:hypothetical protein
MRKSGSRAADAAADEGLADESLADESLADESLADEGLADEAGEHWRRGRRIDSPLRTSWGMGWRSGARWEPCERADPAPPTPPQTRASQTRASQTRAKTRRANTGAGDRAKIRPYGRDEAGWRPHGPGHRRSEPSPCAYLRPTALATMLGMIVGVAAWQVRPQLYSIPLFGGLMAALWAVGAERWRAVDGVRVPTGLWALPLGFAVWANVHGAFIFGLLVLGVEVVARAWRWGQGLSQRARYAVSLPGTLAGGGDAVAAPAPFPWQWVLLGVLCAAATLATPLGTGMVGYVLGFAQHPVTRNLNLEFAPVSARDPVGIVFLVHLGTLLALWLSQRHRPTVREALLVVGFGGLTLVAVRGVLWYGLVTTPMMARALARTPMFDASRPERVGMLWLNRLLLGLLALTAVATCPWLRGYLPHPAIDPAHPYLGEDTPVGAVEVLRELGDVRPFHTEAYGSYLIHAAPEIPVFVDTRIELYPPDQWDDYLAISMARYDWQERLEAYRVNTLLLDKERQPALVEALAREDGDPDAKDAWRIVYEDDSAVILRRIAEGQER